MNFSAISYKSRLGRLLRLPLRLLPGHMTIPILQGKLRGKRWVVGSANHGCWLGSYELDKQSLIAAEVKPGSVFFDVGAHVGFYTLLASVCVGENGKVFAFEPLPSNVSYLEKHLHLNGIKNASVYPVAVADCAGEACFMQGPTSTMGHISQEGTLKVPVVSLDELLGQGSIPAPDYIKIDVEGAELQVLRGAHKLLTGSAAPVIFLATHGAEVQKQCLALLQEMGFTCRPLGKDQEATSCDEWVARKAG